MEDSPIKRNPLTKNEGGEGIDGDVIKKEKATATGP